MEKNNITHLTIVRGFPGSGKTTFGRELAAKQNGLFVEPDMFLYDSNGEYCYTRDAYMMALSSAMALIRSYFMYGGKFAVYADVLPKRSHVGRIGVFCNVFPSITVHDMRKITYEESKARNVHNVCEEDLKRMFEQWEDWQ